MLAAIINNTVSSFSSLRPRLPRSRFVNVNISSNIVCAPHTRSLVVHSFECGAWVPSPYRNFIDRNFIETPLQPNSRNCIETDVQSFATLSPPSSSRFSAVKGICTERKGFLASLAFLLLAPFASHVKHTREVVLARSLCKTYRQSFPRRFQYVCTRDGYEPAAR